METEPVNPFQSPQAVDVPRRIVDYWRPTWRQTVVGLAVIPFLWAAVLTADTFAQCYILGTTLTNPTWLELYADHVFRSAVVTLVFGAPLCSFAWKQFKLTPRGVVSAGGFLVVAFASLAVAWLVIEYFDRPPALRINLDGVTFVRKIVFAFEGLLMLFTPFGLFALYLSFLRRREQTRGNEPRG